MNCVIYRFFCLWFFRLPKTTVVRRSAHVLWGLTPNRRSSDPNLKREVAWPPASTGDQRDDRSRRKPHADVRTRRPGSETRPKHKPFWSRSSRKRGRELLWLTAKCKTSHRKSTGKTRLPSISQRSRLWMRATVRTKRFESPEELEEKRPPASQHPLQTNENIELTPEGLHLDHCTITHDSSESSSQSSMESSSSPNHTTSDSLNDVCSPSQHPFILFFPSADRDAAGDASPASPHKASAGCFLRAFIRR